MSLLKYETVPIAELKARGNSPDRTDCRPVVLIVDDERMIADTLAVILSTQGFFALAAYDGKSALETAEVIPPDVLISDIVMPGMNGVELAMALTAIVPDCRVLLFSGSVSSADVVAAHPAGRAFPVSRKPMHPADLLARLVELGISPKAARA